MKDTTLEKKDISDITFYFRSFVFIFILLILGYWYFDKYQPRSFLVENMKDPTSVIFRNQEKKGDYLCGEVNSKNGFGAYSGFERFIANKKGFFLESGDSRGSQEHYSYEFLDLRLDASIKNNHSSLELNKDSFNLVWSIVCEGNEKN